MKNNYSSAASTTFLATAVAAMMLVNCNCNCNRNCNCNCNCEWHPPAIIGDEAGGRRGSAIKVRGAELAGVDDGGWKACGAAVADVHRIP